LIGSQIGNLTKKVMRTKWYTALVIMPDGAQLEVIYYCTNTSTGVDRFKKQKELLIQFNDCICTVKIDKSICEQPDELERIVHNKVISTKGHLC
jgi:hypothetical protein